MREKYNAKLCSYRKQKTILIVLAQEHLQLWGKAHAGHLACMQKATHGLVTQAGGRQGKPIAVLPATSSTDSLRNCSLRHCATGQGRC